MAVFESLVQSRTSESDCQLIYTTHSPFLVSRNFAQRLRLVRKGDAEEGTQLASEATLRRYEPVRSALGIDCAQTLFMGATNLVVEGPTDQYLLSELVRAFATPDTIEAYIDLNEVVIVSAESASGVSKMLAASQWSDEIPPATVVILDSDSAGDQEEDRITKKTKGKSLIDPELVLRIGDLPLSSTARVTIEDLVPAEIYREAIADYLERWCQESVTNLGGRDEVLKRINSVGGSKDGIASEAKGALASLTDGDPIGFDKYGILEQVIAIVREKDRLPEATKGLSDSLASVCETIKLRLATSKRKTRSETGKQNVRRLIRDFFVRNRSGASVFELLLLLERLQGDADELGEDASTLDRSLKSLQTQLRGLRDAGQRSLVEGSWSAYKSCLDALSKNPLSTTIIIDDETPTVSTES